MSALRLIVGLGNPGVEHLATRHNAGFWFADALAESQSARFGYEAKLRGDAARILFAGEPLWLLKPATFMNASGASVGAALRYFKIEPEQMLVVHDDLDLPPGTARLKFDGGHGGQNGLRDIVAQLGHGLFHRLRIGIGHPGHKDRVLGWVLGRPSAADEQAMRDAIDTALDVLPLVAGGEIERAMKVLHTSRESAMGNGES